MAMLTSHGSQKAHKLSSTNSSRTNFVGRNRACLGGIGMLSLFKKKKHSPQMAVDAAPTASKGLDGAHNSAAAGGPTDRTRRPTGHFAPLASPLQQPQHWSNPASSLATSRTGHSEHQARCWPSRHPWHTCRTPKRCVCLPILLFGILPSARAFRAQQSAARNHFPLVHEAVRMR